MFSAYFSENKQNSFRITVQNANPNDKDRFKEIVFNIFKKVSKEGFDKATLEGIINRIEFSLVEGDTSQKGLMYMYMILQTWFFSDNPFLALEFESSLAKTKEIILNNSINLLVEKYLVNNNHSVLMVLKPEIGLQQNIDLEIQKKLSEYKNSLSKQELINLVNETNELKSYQEKKDSPEAISSIPMLSLSDISPEVEWYNLEEKKIGDVPLLFNEDFTNNILYTKLYFDLKVLPQKLIPYAELLSSIIGTLDTKNYSYGELDDELNIHTGGCYTGVSAFLEENSDDKLLPKFIVTAKSTSEKCEKLFELISETFIYTKFSDVKRLKVLLIRFQSRVEADIKQNGVNCAITRLISYYSNSGMFSETINGLEYYNFITDITTNFDSKQQEIIDNLQLTANLLFTKQNLVVGVSCSADNLEQFTNGVKQFITKLPAGTENHHNWKFDLEVKNEGLISSSKVQFVVKGYDFSKLGYSWNGKLAVLKQILSREWLQTQIRVLGGAYGGFCGFTPTGQAYFASYRDPNLTETLTNFDNTPEYLKSFTADELEMTRFIIGTISNIDKPTTPSQRGNVAFSRYFRKVTKEDLKNERAAILSTTQNDIKDMSKMVSDVLSQGAICVYGSEKKILESKDLFKKVYNVTQ